MEKMVSVWGWEKVFEDDCLEDFMLIKEEKDIDMIGVEKFYIC